MADISQELSAIKNSVYGKNMRTAIHDAIKKVNEDSAGSISERLGGLSFAKISQADYEALETKDPDTVYYVYDENGNISQYVGEAKTSSGDGATNAYVSSNSAGAALLGNMEYLDPNIILSDWEQGDITSSGNVDSTTKIRIPNYIDLPQGVTSVYFIGNNTANKTLQFAIETYDVNNNFLEDLYWYGVSANISITNTSAAKFRSVIQFSDRSNITPEDIDNVRMFYTTEEV